MYVRMSNGIQSDNKKTCVPYKIIHRIFGREKAGIQSQEEVPKDRGSSMEHLLYKLGK